MEVDEATGGGEQDKVAPAGVPVAPKISRKRAKASAAYQAKTQADRATKAPAVGTSSKGESGWTDSLKKHLVTDGVVIARNGTIVSTKCKDVGILCSHFCRAKVFAEGLNGHTTISGERIQIFAMVSDEQMMAAPLYADSLLAGNAAKKAFETLFVRVEDVFFEALQELCPGKFQRHQVQVDKNFVAFLYNTTASATGQILHADSGSRYNFRALVNLSPQTQATLFIPYDQLVIPKDEAGAPISMTDLDKDLNEDNQFCSPGTKEAYSQRFHLLVLPTDSGVTPPVPSTRNLQLEDADERLIFNRLFLIIEYAKKSQALATPIDDNINQADTLLFSGDLLHRGARLTEAGFRLLLFIPVTVVGQYGGDKQLHPITLSEYIHGRHTLANLETIFAFMMAVEVECPDGKIDYGKSTVVKHSGKFSEFPNEVRYQLMNMKDIYERGKPRGWLDAEIKRAKPELECAPGEW